MKTVAVSGGFDPIHRGHVDLIEEAAHYGRLIVFLNTDRWLMDKKGYTFMPFEDRARIIMAMRGVEMVVPAKDEDGSVCDSLRDFKPDIFCNGGDRLPDNTPEVLLCEELGIEMKWNVGGEKVESSSELVENVRAEVRT